MSDPENDRYYNPDFPAPAPVVQRGVVDQPHDGVWLNTAFNTLEYVMAQKMATDSTLDTSNFAQVPDTVVDIDELSQSVLEEPPQKINGPVVTLLEFNDWHDARRLFYRTNLIYDGRQYARILIIPDHVDPSDLNIEASVSRKDADGDLCFTLVDWYGRVVGETTKQYLSGMEALEVLLRVPESMFRGMR